MLLYVLMAIAIVLSVFSNIILHSYKNRDFQTPGDVFLFNSGISLVWLAVLIVWSVMSGDFTISGGSVFFGAVYGVTLALFLYFKTQSMSEGPVALTSLISNCAFLIATWFGVVYADETVKPLQYVGMGIILASLALCVNPKKSGERLMLRWFVYCFAFFLAGGFIGIFYKVFGKSDVSSQINSMMLTAAVVSACLFTVFGFIINKATGMVRPKIYKNSLAYMLLCGIAGCIYIRLNVSLSAQLPSVIFFPVSNGANVILSTLCSRILFREKLSSWQTTGIALGLGAIVLIGVA